MEGFTVAAKVGELGPGDIKMIEVGDEILLLINVDGELHSINNECTHMACDLGYGILEGEMLRCPCHDSWFSVKTGEADRPPAVDPVTVYAVRVEGDDVLIGPK